MLCQQLKKRKIAVNTLHFHDKTFIIYIQTNSLANHYFVCSLSTTIILIDIILLNYFKMYTQPKTTNGF